MNVSSEYLNAICEGCLSPDRQLTAEITEVAIKKVFYEILNEAGVVDGLTLRLCFECKASIQRFLSFKRQVIEAHDTLTKHLLKPSQESLSKLNIDTDVLEQPTATNTDQRQHKKGSELRSREPLTFIKIEDGALDEVEGYFVDDSYIQDDDVDDKHLTVILNTDYKEPINIKSRNKTKKEIDYDFNDSDEEPLKNKKKEVEGVRVKKEKRRKKHTSSKIDRRKNPAAKREVPPGVINNPRVSKKLQQLNVGQGQLEMVVLSWEEVEAERQKALSSIVFTRHEYRCYDCVLGFNHKFKLENHMKKHEQSAGEMLCNVCKVRCRDSRALCAHRRRHRVRWRCCACGSLSSRAAVGADHIARAHHAPAPSHTCGLCGHCAPTLGKLRNHIKNHAERQKCELCGKTFRDRTSLRTHLFIHRGEKEYSCPRCEKRFLFKKAMEVHLVTHDAPAHLYCYQCDMNFKNRMSYTQHMKYSLKHIDPAKLKYACHLCDKKFIKATRLEEHNLAVHLKATPIRCTMQGCNFACSSRPVLRTHVRMIHRNARALRNHVCDTCGKTYTTKKTLEGHLRSHTGERPFKCVQCPSTFGYEAALYNHNKLVHLKAKMGRSRPPAIPQLPVHIPTAPTDVP